MSLWSSRRCSQAREAYHALFAATPTGLDSSQLRTIGEPIPEAASWAGAGSRKTHNLRAVIDKPIRIGMPIEGWTASTLNCAEHGTGRKHEMSDDSEPPIPHGQRTVVAV